MDEKNPGHQTARESAGTSHFLAILSRMKYIERWSLMRNSRPENLSEHSLEVALIAHMLCVIGNARHGRSLDAERAALVALYHDASEIVTGDLPTPVKYHDGAIRDAYKAVERSAEERLLDALPADLRPSFEDVLWPAADASENELYLRRLVKAADKISALIKCVEEARSGNTEFHPRRRVRDGRRAPRGGRLHAGLLPLLRRHPRRPPVTKGS